MKIYRTPDGVVGHDGSRWLRARTFSFDALFQGGSGILDAFDEERGPLKAGSALLPPLESQEIWAAGVTYFRSREARMEESEKEADVYDRVYSAERPELFFKATPHRVVGHRQNVVIRSDSTWNVPEAELAIAVSAGREIIGFSIGNDMSSRSIEGENPLYLPQAKIYDGSCALGPCLVLQDKPLSPETAIRLRVERGGDAIVDDKTSLEEMKRSPENLVSYLFRHNSFPNGAYLLTGTGIVPDASFTLEPGDEITITIDGLGTLSNIVSSVR
ncbi:MAG TPA: fumarylacetoacetate hydrolase family protein [Vicinamibacteria bacterium]|nr:fumarylacetoacetate hydrolase family protein [Vicinamibacteria bacterium]